MSEELESNTPSDAATCSLRASELLEIREAIWAAMDDIGEHLQVAKYNLRGECCGQIMPRPNPPQLIHEAGIKASEEVKERLRLASCKISAILKAENANVDLPDTAAQDSASKTNNPAVSG